MSISTLAFNLQDGYVMNWLVAGPQVILLDNQTDYSGAKAKLEVTQALYEEKSGISAAPVERGPLHEGVFKIGEYEGHWEYHRCGEDRLIDHSITLGSCSALRSWAYVQVTNANPAEQAANLVLSTFGPVDVWVNKKNVCHHEVFSDHLSDIPFTAALKSGKNQILVRFAGVAAPDCQMAVALRLQSAAISVHIPTLIPSIARRNELEAVNEEVYLDRDVYAPDDKITLRWPAGIEKSAYQDVRLQTPSGRIYGQAEDIGKPGAVHIMGSPAAIPEGPYQIFLMPRAWEYYKSNIRITKALNLWSMGLNRFSDQPYNTLEERRQEALMRAARTEDNLFAEVAKAALQRAGLMEHPVLERAIEMVNQRQRDSDVQLLGLLGLLVRYGSQPDFPEAIKEKIKNCALNFCYGPDEPGSCALHLGREGHQIIIYACAVLAGQLYPAGAFTRGGLTGRQLRKKGEALALAWMQARGASGFVEWDTKATYAEVLMALSYLVDLSKTESLWELASVLMDKILYSIALNSFKGVFGAAQGCAGAPAIKSALLEETSGITRLMWGLGVYNHHIAGLVSLACMEKYELPSILADIATGAPEEIWNREQHASAAHPVNKVTYRTPDYMLSSAQDYRPGERGDREHIWQATLGPQSIVFVTHPGCSSETDAHAPNFWLGNAVLPRVAQWKDTLVALYNFPENAWLKFTHACFPTSDFDEYSITEHPARLSTAFARKGDGYLALTASRGLELVTTGHTAYRELRSVGNQNIWLCQMGRAALDGDFIAFQKKVLAAQVSFDNLNLECQTLRGESLSFGWETPLRINGAAQPLSGFKHFENPFTVAELPCNEMEIKTQDYLLRLKFDAL